MLKQLERYESAIIDYVNSCPLVQTHISNLSQLADGLILTDILKQVDGFRFQFGELSLNIQNWGQRLKNLRVIVKKVQKYFQHKIFKGIKTKDINLIAIAYNQNPLEVRKLFEVVLATLIEAPNKEDHIQKIMKLDQETQEVFVKMIQKLMEQRVLNNNEKKEEKYEYILEELGAENSLLREQITNLQLQKQNDSKELEQLKIQAKKSSGDFQCLIKSMELDSDEWSLSAIVQNQTLKNNIDSLKKQISTLKNQHQAETFKFKEQIIEKQSKLIKLTQVQEMLQLYKEKYKEASILAKQAEDWEKQKKKLTKSIEEKEALIKKLQDKVQTIFQQNCAFQQREVYFQMEIQKRQVRFQELQREVRKRMKSHEDLSIFPTSSQTLASLVDLNEPNEQIEELESEVNKLKIKQREAYWNKNQLKRKTQQQKNLMEQKKKLQRIILQLSKAKRDEMEMLLAVIYDLNVENRKFRKLLDQNTIKFD